MTESDFDRGSDVNDSIQQQQPPCTGTVPASKRPKQAGSCIGVLYSCPKGKDTEFCQKCGTEIYCIHNGRLVQNTKDYILVNHYTIDHNGHPKEETRMFFRTGNNFPHVVSYKVIPNLSSAPSVTGNYIVTGDCVGIEFHDPSKPFNKDIKNGRFLFWTDKNANVSYKLNLGVKPYRVYYYHYPQPSCGPLGKKPNLVVAELACRENIIQVYKLSKKDLGKDILKC